MRVPDVNKCKNRLVHDTNPNMGNINRKLNMILGVVEVKYFRISIFLDLSQYAPVYTPHKGSLHFSNKKRWNGYMDGKKLAGEKAVHYVKDGMIIGLGTGSTVYWTIKKLGELVKNGLEIRCVPTSKNTEILAKKVGIPLITISEVNELDLTIDGADEVNRNLDLIKGGGGALLREKMVASISRCLIIVVDESKSVLNLGRFPLPVEVVPFGFEITSKQLSALDCIPILRTEHNIPFITDNGNYILDCHFSIIQEPHELNRKLNMIPGVVENGLFIKMADIVVIGDKNGNVNILNNTK